MTKTQKWEKIALWRDEARKPRAGFTFPEVLVSVAVLVLLAMFIFGALASFRESASLDQAVDVSLELLRDARSRTLGAEGGLPYGVHFASTTATLFSGGVYQAGGADNIVEAFPPLVEISVIALGTTTNSVVFEQLTGNATATGTVQFTTTRSQKTKQIQILPSGVFRKL